MAHGRKQKAHAEEHSSSERWLLTYADLITLLMVFFVVLYAMSTADTTKFKAISAALQHSFNVDVLRGQAATSVGDGSAGTPPAPQDSSIDDVQVQAAVRLQARIQMALEGITQAPDVSVTTDKDGVVIRLSGSNLFDSGRAELKPNSLIVLDTISAELRLVPNDIRVDGHTDSVAIDSPRYPTNWELSTARALAVTRYLTDTSAVPAARLMAAGFGEFRPLVANDSREHRAMNRRVEIHLLSTTTPTLEQAFGPTPQPTPPPTSEPTPPFAEHLEQ